MKVAYIAGPYRAERPHDILENIRKAERVALKYWAKGYAVICPHMNTRLFDQMLPDEVWLSGDLEMILRSDVIVMIEGWEKSEGATEELFFAKNYNKEVIFDEERKTTNNNIRKTNTAKKAKSNKKR